MPLKTLRRYAKDLTKVGGVMVMQGAINGLQKMAPTMQFTADVLKLDGSCKSMCTMQNTAILMDPILFRAYGIKQVPAIAYQKNLNTESHCSDNGAPRVTSPVVYGDASIKGLLEELYSLSGEEILKNLAYKL